ncbi:hypothetical protein BRARA_F03326 [Brassica rapa]|uniref:Reverse transcriptase zinc-binding domain-containing protein n=1 Tax=Brassica campestris TaxID=3711 RepID=A0A397Z372_BRACM|nr:hypothetical protein BRARA_F03326 [Brassica rapa]
MLTTRLNLTAPPLFWELILPWLHNASHSQLARDRMVTRDRLLRRGLTVPPTCVLCVGYNEIRHHLFFFYRDYNMQVWSFFVSRLNISPPLLFDDGLRWLKNSSRDKNVNLIVRNSRIHIDVARPPEAIIAETKLVIRLRLDPLSRVQILGP